MRHVQKLIWQSFTIKILPGEKRPLQYMVSINNAIGITWHVHVHIHLLGFGTFMVLVFMFRAGLGCMYVLHGLPELKQQLDIPCWMLIHVAFHLCTILQLSTL